MHFSTLLSDEFLSIATMTLLFICYLTMGILIYLFCFSTLLSDEFLSIATMTLLFICYLTMGILHDSSDDGEGHSLVDITYFWIVSLTTVGFGDVKHSLGM